MTRAATVSVTTFGALLMLTACGSPTPAAQGTASTTPPGVQFSTPVAKPGGQGPNWQPARATTAVEAERGYLNAAERGDCQTAERYVGGHVLNGDPWTSGMPIPGDFCPAHSIAFDRWQNTSAPRTAKDGNEVEFAVQLHVTKANGCGSCHTGTMNFILTFDKTPLGWLLENGGTGP